MLCFPRGKSYMYIIYIYIYIYIYIHIYIYIYIYIIYICNLGESFIKSSAYGKLLGIKIDSKFHFDDHVKKLTETCKY